MPTLSLQLCPPQPPEVLRSLAQALTRITAHCLGKRPDVTAVMIDALPQGHWFIGGQTPQRPTACLAVRITAGTNTSEEKAAFIREAHALLAEALGGQGGLEEASYVVVQELPASDWGYGGRTQLARRNDRSAPLPKPCPGSSAVNRP
jgi:4-oxalocrotonate tautomerase